MKSLHKLIAEYWTGADDAAQEYYDKPENKNKNPFKPKPKKSGGLSKDMKSQKTSGGMNSKGKVFNPKAAKRTLRQNLKKDNG